MYDLLNRKVLSYRCNFLIACFVSLVMLAGATYKANAQNGAITMLVPSGCNNAGYQYTFSSINQAAKDTIPLEWWSPADLGVSVIPYSTLQAASIQVRSRLYSNQLNPLQYPVHYYSANINTRAGQSLASFPNCNNYTMNTVVGAGNSYGNASNYLSNSATDSTTGNYIVQLDGVTPAQVGFYPPIQLESTTCTEQSDDWKFCSISSLGRDVNRSGNRYVRRLNTSPANRIELQGEAFYRRDQRNGFYWWCRTSVAGWTGKCYMSAEPNNQYGYPSSVSYWTQSPQLSYRVAFPVSDGSTRWYIWVRGRGCTVNDDTVHTGMNGQRTISAEDMAGWGSCSFVWSKSNFYPPDYKAFVIPNYSTTNSSFQDINVWMREDGFIFDKIILTTDVNYVP